MANQNRNDQLEPPDEPTPEREPSRPWRTEGLSKPKDEKPGPRWKVLGALALGYLFLFALLTVQDQLAGPESVSYTEFKTQVAAGNVAEVFARGNTIQGALKKPAPLPGGEGTYQQFTTERPTFATDDLLGELSATGATVRATPISQERGLLTNLLISMAPFLLLIGFYAWLFRRQQGALGGGLLRGGVSRKPVDPRSVRVTFDDVAGIDEVEAEISEIVDYRKDPAKSGRVGARAPKACCWPGRRAPARRCWRARRRARRTCRSSAPARRSSSR